MKKYAYVDGRMQLVEEITYSSASHDGSNAKFSELQGENDRLKQELQTKMEEAEKKFSELQGENERLTKQIEKLKARQTQ